MDDYDAESWNGVTDYILMNKNGEVLAIVEAKKTSHDPRLPQAQTEHYMTEISKHQSFQPFAFMTNEEDIYFFDKGYTAVRKAYSFFSRGDLEQILSLREKKQLLTNTPINQNITNRVYQIDGIKRVAEAFEQGRRKALLIMATVTRRLRAVMQDAESEVRHAVGRQGTGGDCESVRAGAVVVRLNKR